MSNGKRRDWYDEIYEDFIFNTMTDENTVESYMPFGRNSIDIKFKDKYTYRYNYYAKTLVRLDTVTEDDNDRMKQIIKDLFPRKLIKAIRDAGMSQKDLATEAGVMECAISKYCNGDSIPNIVTISLIAKALKCELYELIPFYDFEDNHIK